MTNMSKPPFPELEALMKACVSTRTHAYVVLALPNAETVYASTGFDTNEAADIFAVTAVVTRPSPHAGLALDNAQEPTDPSKVN